MSQRVTRMRARWSLKAFASCYGGRFTQRVNYNLSVSSQSCMRTECTSRSAARLVICRTIFAAAIVVFPVQPAPAQSSAHHASIWGPLFQSRVTSCWRKPARFVDELTKIKAVFEIRLSRDGWLIGEPLLSSESVLTASEDSKAYREGALRAIRDCQPYALPAEYHDEWKHFSPVFFGPQVPPNEKGKRPAGLFETRSPSICRGC
jgi:hypothetical protein